LNVDLTLIARRPPVALSRLRNDEARSSFLRL